MSSSQYLDRVIKALQIMPGIGPRSATRIAYHLIDRRKDDALVMAQSIIEAMEHIKLCQHCRNYADDDICLICQSPKRSVSSTLCIVENPSDVQAIEAAGSFGGLYFVLHGHLSPIEGIGPRELGLDVLDARLDSGDIKEIILATNPTVEGDATASYIAAIARKYSINVSKIASGVPLGGDLDSVDENTLATSIQNRRPF